MENEQTYFPSEDWGCLICGGKTTPQSIGVCADCQSFEQRKLPESELLSALKDLVRQCSRTIRGHGMGTTIDEAYDLNLCEALEAIANAESRRAGRN